MMQVDATLNPVTFQVIQSRLSGIVQEMQDNIFRTGYSTVVRESQDAGCVLFDAEGNVVGERVIYALHLRCLGDIIRAIRRDFGDDIQRGDAFLTNDPYFAGVTHAMDIAVVTPLFHDGELLAFCGSIAHKTDLGGVVPGTANANARDMFQEGTRYPLCRFERDFTIDRDIEAILRANSRTPDVILGDIRGQVGVGRLGERRLAEVIARYGRDSVVASFRELQDVAERRLREQLRALPDGVHEAEHHLDRDAGQLVRYHLRVTKQGDRIHFDFSDSDDQTTAPINIRPPVAYGAVAYAVIAMIDPSLPNNGGIARVVETTFRPGSVLNPHYPAPTNSYMPSATLVTEICIRALGGFVPERCVANCSSGAGLSIGGRHADGTSFLEYELFASAAGGREGSDGPSGVSTLLSNTRCTPIEVIENEFPTRILRWELVRDSGGPGTFRGGLGVRRMWQLLGSVNVTLRGSGHVVAAQGLNGGEPGTCGRFVINPGKPDERSMPPLFSGLELHEGAVLLDERGGGGGVGDPHRRATDRIVADVLDGHVSIEAAVDAYGADQARLEEALTTS